MLTKLSKGGFTAKELRGFRDMLYAESDDQAYAGYTAKELRDGKVDFSAAELRGAGYNEVELREALQPAGAVIRRLARLSELAKLELTRFTRLYCMP